MKEELISVIVPIYKVEDYIRECIESIINQTYKNLEIILVDDGSPDNCGQICDDYAKKDNRIKVIHKENGGLSSARNAGLEIAKGEYISFIDSDDYVSERFIEILYRLCYENNADVAECNLLRFKNKIEKIEYSDGTVNLYDNIQMQMRLYAKPVQVRTVIVCNKLYKKVLFETLRFPVGKINEDEFTTYKVFNNTDKKIVVTSEILYFYRYNENSITGRSFNVKRLDVFEAYDERMAFYQKVKQKFLYNCTIVKYQEILADYYVLAKKEITVPKEALNIIYNKAKENFEKYKNIKNIPLKKRIKVKLFMSMPNLYSYLISIKRFIGIKFNAEK